MKNYTLLNSYALMNRRGRNLVIACADGMISGGGEVEKPQDMASLFAASKEEPEIVRVDHSAAFAPKSYNSTVKEWLADAPYGYVRRVGVLVHVKKYSIRIKDKKRKGPDRVAEGVTFTISSGKYDAPLSVNEKGATFVSYNWPTDNYLELYRSIDTLPMVVCYEVELGTVQKGFTKKDSLCNLIKYTDVDRRVTGSPKKSSGRLARSVEASPSGSDPFTPTA